MFFVAAFLAAITAPAAGAQLQKLSDRYLRARAQEDPVVLVSAEGTARRRADDRSLLAALERIDRRSLAPEQQIDAALLDDALRYELWRHARLKEWTWDVQRYQDLTRDALSDLPAAGAESARKRLLGAARRFSQMPAFFARIRELVDPARVPAAHARLVAEQNRHLLDGLIEPLAQHAHLLSARDRRALDDAATALRSEVAGQQHWLDTVLVPHATGSFRLGAALYDTKARYEMGTALSQPEIEAKAREAIATMRSRMYVIAREVLGNRPDAPPLPATPSNAEEDAAVRGPRSAVHWR